VIVPLTDKKSGPTSEAKEHQGCRGEVKTRCVMVALNCTILDED